MARAGVIGIPGSRGFTSGSAPLIPAKTFEYTNGDVTLSNNDSTATFNTVDSYDAVTSVVLATSGNFYFEFISDCSVVSSIYGGWAFHQQASAAGGTTDPSGWGGDHLGFRCNQTTMVASGTGYTATASLTAYGGSSSRFGFAINLTTGNVWIRQDSATFVASGNPVAGTNAAATIPAGTNNLRIGSSDFRNSNFVTLVSPSLHSWAAPSGFTAV